MMKFIRFAVIFLLIGLILYWPVSALLSLFQSTGGGNVVATDSASSTDEQGQREGAVLGEEVFGENFAESGLAPTVHTSAAYQAPAYDPFHNQHRNYEEFREEILPEDRGHNTAPTARLRIRTLEKGLADEASGTTGTTFIFDAFGSSDHETRSERLQVRFDFDSDGIPETWFSQKKSATHSFEKAGVYTVTVEVLDGGGLVSRASRQVKVVNNTAPTGRFTYAPITGTTNQIFTFRTHESQDSQYRSQYLEYRFDWEGDGVWDTPYQQKTLWRHRYETAGRHTVLMETRDPEGAVDITRAVIVVTENIAPHAAFTFLPRQSSRGMTFTFDASQSSDFEAPNKLMYRWDFDYQGKDDIHFDTRWSSSPRYTGSYDFSDNSGNFSGTRVVRLQVRDQDGAVAQAIRRLY